MINITVEDRNGTVRILKISYQGVINLMETLRLYDYNMRATCGGMGLCADCHCQIINGSGNLPDPQEEELITLDEQPNGTNASRLACQIKVGNNLDGLQIKLLGSSE